MAIISGYLMPHPPVLIPEVGQGRQHLCSQTAEGFAAAASEIGSSKPSLLVLITPHGPMFSDGLAISAENHLEGDFKAFGSPGAKIRCANAPEWERRIVREAGTLGIPMVGIDKVTAKRYGVGTDLDHGALVPLYFINRQWTEYRLVHITYGLLSLHSLYRFGKLLHTLFSESDEAVTVIASGDLSHRLKDEGPYDYHPDGPRFDEAVVQSLSAGDFVKLLTLDTQLVHNAGECAYRSLAILGGVMDTLAFTSRCHSYEGPFGVGYAICGMTVTGTHESRIGQLESRWAQAREAARSQEDPWVRLARAVVESYVRHRTVPQLPENLPEPMVSDRKGVFVSLKGPSGLRGCIGTFSPTTESIAMEIVENAVKAASEDPRFPVVEPEELEELVITVDVLDPPEPISGLSELDPKRYGVIVSCGHRRGLLLPDLEGVDTAEEQVRIARQKAGISAEEAVSLQRFEVFRHH